MFENIIGHKKTVEQIKKEIETATFPSSILFSGSLYSGKETVALEASRALTCTGDRSWNCSCQSCYLNRTLSNPSVMILGSDNFLQEITAAKKILQNAPAPASCYFFIRSVRKLLRRLDPSIADETSSKYKKILPYADSAEELLSELNPIDFIEKEESVAKKISCDAKKLDKIIDSCRAIVKEYNFSAISVEQIRKIGYWVRFTGYGKKKIVIIENAHTMNESSRNALLKVLEEPPDERWFFLLTPRPGEIIPTIKSRLRKYDFKERTIQENKIVIEKIFREDSALFSTIKEYFDSRTPEAAAVKAAAEKFMVDLFENNRLSSEVKAVIKGDFPVPYTDFLKELLSLVSLLTKSSDFIIDSPINLVFIEKAGKIINNAYKKFDSLNMNQELLTEAIFFELKGILETV